MQTDLYTYIFWFVKCRERRWDKEREFFCGDGEFLSNRGMRWLSQLIWRLSQSAGWPKPPKAQKKLKKTKNPKNPKNIKQTENQQTKRKNKPNKRTTLFGSSPVAYLTFFPGFPRFKRFCAFLLVNQIKWACPFLPLLTPDVGKGPKYWKSEGVRLKSAFAPENPKICYFSLWCPLFSYFSSLVIVSDFLPNILLVLFLVSFKLLILITLLFYSFFNCLALSSASSRF